MANLKLDFGRERFITIDFYKNDLPSGTVISYHGYIWVKKGGHFENFGKVDFTGGNVGPWESQFKPNSVVGSNNCVVEVLGTLKNIILEIEQ